MSPKQDTQGPNLALPLESDHADLRERIADLETRLDVITRSFANQDSEEDTLLDVRAIRAYLHLSEPTVLTLLRRGEIPARKVGGKWRAHKSDLKTWIRAGSGQ